MIAGKLYVTPPPSVIRSRSASSWARLFRVDDDLGLGILFPGPLDVLFGEGDFIEPDGLFVRRDRMDIIKDPGIEGVPDLIIECVAPETAERDRGLKRERYAFFGVPEYRVFDAEKRRLEIYRNDAPDPHDPNVVHDHWTWQPIPNGPALELSLLEILERCDDAIQFLEPYLLRWRAARKTLTVPPLSS